MSEDLLGPMERPMPKRKTSSGKEASGAAKHIAQYHDTFLAKFGFKPTQLPRFGKVAKELAAAWGDDAVTEVIAKFFTTRDPRIVGSDYGVGIFQREAQRLRMAQRALDPRTAANAHEVAKASGRG